MREFVVFRLGAKEFGIGVEKIIEVIKYPKVFALPESMDFITGVITLRGEVIPLIDLRKRFGIDPSPGKERAVVVRTGKEKVAMVVDEVRGIEEFQPQEVSKPHVIFKGLKTEYMTGLCRRGNVVVIILDIDNILSAEEKIILRESVEDIGPGGSVESGES